MKPLFAIALFLISWLVFARAEEPARDPIVVVMKRDSPFRPEVNGKKYSLGDFKRFLADTAKRFGSKDPVIIRLDEDKDIYLAVVLVKIAHQTHDSVAMEISSPKSGGAKYIIQIPKDGIKTVLDGRTVGSSHTIIPDPNPNSQRDRQIRRLNNLQNGIIETK